MCFDPVRDHQRLVHGEQGGQFGLVGLELVPSGADGDVLLGRVLELDQSERQAVDSDAVDEHAVEGAVACFK